METSAVSGSFAAISSQGPRPDVYLVLDGVLLSWVESETGGSDSMSTHRTRAMQMVVAFVIETVLYSAEDGRALFFDTLRQMGESKDAMIRGLAFTLMISAAAQACVIPPGNTG